MALVQSQSAHRSASPYAPPGPNEPARTNATIPPHTSTTRSTDSAATNRNGKRSVSSGHVKMASAGQTRVPVPPLLGSAPPFLDGRNRVSSNPSRPIPPRSASQSSFSNPHPHSRTISSSSVSPSSTSPKNQFNFPQQQQQPYPFLPSSQSSGSLMQNGWNGGANSNGGNFAYLSPEQQHQAMLMQQAQYQQQQWQVEMMRGQPNQQYDWSQQGNPHSFAFATIPLTRFVQLKISLRDDERRPVQLLHRHSSTTRILLRQSLPLRNTPTGLCPPFRPERCRLNSAVRIRLRPRVSKDEMAGVGQRLEGPSRGIIRTDAEGRTREARSQRRRMVSRARRTLQHRWREDRNRRRSSTAPHPVLHQIQILLPLLTPEPTRPLPLLFPRATFLRCLNRPLLLRPKRRKVRRRRRLGRRID